MTSGINASSELLTLDHLSFMSSSTSSLDVSSSSSTNSSQSLVLQVSFLDPQVLVLTAIFIAIIVGNLPVVITIIFGRLGRTRMYYFLLHLCFADLITGIFNVIPQIAWELTRHFYGGNFLCKLVKYLQILGPYLSSYTLTVMSIDRFLAICHPLTNNHLSLDRAKKSIVVAWILSLLFCSPQAVIFSYIVMSPETDVMECWATFPYQPWGVRLYVTWYAFSVFIVPFVIIFFTHLMICCELWKTSKERKLTQKRKKAMKGQLSQSPCDHNDHSDISPSGRKTRFSFPSFNLHQSFNTHRKKSHQENESNNDTHVRQDARHHNPFNESLLFSKTRTDETEILQSDHNHYPQQRVNFNQIPHEIQYELHVHHNQLESLVNNDDKEGILQQQPSTKSVSSTSSILKHHHGDNTFVQIQGSDLIPETNLVSSGSTEHQEAPSSATSSGNNPARLVIGRQGSSRETTPGDLTPVDRRSPSVDRMSARNQSKDHSETRDIQRCVSQEEEHLRAKIKSVKLTVTVILCYVFCSMPFLCVQLWATWYPGAQETSLWTGEFLNRLSTFFFRTC